MKIASFEMNTHVYAYELQISWERSGGPRLGLAGSVCTSVRVHVSECVGSCD